MIIGSDVTVNPRVSQLFDARSHDPSSCSSWSQTNYMVRICSESPRQPASASQGQVDGPCQAAAGRLEAFRPSLAARRGFSRLERRVATRRPETLRRPSRWLRHVAGHDPRRSWGQELDHRSRADRPLTGRRPSRDGRADPEDVRSIVGRTISASEYALLPHRTPRSECGDSRPTHWLAPHTHHPRVHSGPLGRAGTPPRRCRLATNGCGWTRYA